MKNTILLTSCVVVLLVSFSPRAVAAPPPVTFNEAVQSRDDRDKRVVYSVVKSFMDVRGGVYIPWGEGKDPEDDYHDYVIYVAKQTAIIGATLYYLKYPGLFWQFDGGELYERLLVRWTFKDGATVQNCFPTDHPSTQTSRTTPAGPRTPGNTSTATSTAPSSSKASARMKTTIWRSD